MNLRPRASALYAADCPIFDTRTYPQRFETTFWDARSSGLTGVVLILDFDRF